ncbi:MAG: SDR family oxidoreductase, partial [Elusimicrobiota bacterium]
MTGAARRVGRSIALALAAEGADLALHYNRSRTEALSLAREIERRHATRARVFKAELARPREVEGLAERVLRAMGPVRVLVNNASLYEPSPLGRVSWRDFNDNIAVNLRAPFFLAQAFAPAMRAAGGGSIINIADWAALRPYAGYIPYCVSKAGLLCLNTALAKALAPRIRVNALLPGPVLLPEGFSKARREAVREAVPLKRLGTPAEVARAVVFLVRSDFITGAALPVDGLDGEAIAARPG